MKEKLLRIYRISISTICAMVFSFAPISNLPIDIKAEEVEYISKWNVAEELKASIKDLGGGIPYNEMFMYSSNYYGKTGIKSTSYSASGTSYIYGNVDSNGQSWKSLVAIGSNGLYISSASADAKGITFTAPTSGKFEIIPEKLDAYSDYSVFATNGNWRFEILKGNETLYNATVSSNGGISLDKINVSLVKGDVLKFLFYAPGYKTNGYAIHSNFAISLVEEYKTQVLVNPQYAEKVYNASEYLTGVTSSELTNNYSIAPFSAICGSNDASVELVGFDGYEDGYICTKPKEKYLEEARINVSDNGDLEISFIGNLIYKYSVFYYDKGAFRPVEEIDNGKFYLFSIYKDYVDLCFKAVDEKGETAEYYLTYVYKSGLIYSFKINGKTVFDKADVDINSGSFDVSVSGKIMSVNYDGQALELTDNQTKIYEDKNGIHILEFVFGDYKKSIEVNAYNAVESNYNRLIGHINIDNNKIDFFASKYESVIYSYSIEDFGGEIVYSNLKQTNRDKAFIDGFGIYNATIGIKNSLDALNSSSFNQQIEIKRPGGEWNLEVITSGSADKIIYSSVGHQVDFVASSTFAGSVLNNVNYAYYLKSGNSLTLLKGYSEDGSAQFIPEGSGVYEIYVTARGDGSGSAEIVEVIDVVVLDDAYSGTVSVKNYNFNGAGEIARIEAEATITNSQEIYYRFYAVYQDDIVLIKDYSLDNFVEFVPTRPECFNVRVEVKNQNNSSNYDVFCLYEYQHVCNETELYSLAEYPCDDDAVSVSVCDICGKKITVSNITVDEHDYGEWETTKEPTIIIEGERKRVCKRHFEHVEYETIEALKPDETELNLTKTLIAKYILGYEVEVYPHHDVNCDGVIDVGDLVLIELYIKGYNIEI